MALFFVVENIGFCFLSFFTFYEYQINFLREEHLTYLKYNLS